MLLKYSQGAKVGLIGWRNILGLLCLQMAVIVNAVHVLVPRDLYDLVRRNSFVCQFLYKMFLDAEKETSFA